MATINKILNKQLLTAALHTPHSVAIFWYSHTGYEEIY